MALDDIDGAAALQIITSRYDQRDWRKKIEKTLSLPSNGLGNEIQRKIFMYLKVALQAYKSRRADPPSWIVGGYATKEVIDRIRYHPKDIDARLTEEQVVYLGVDPGLDIDQAWWEEMLVKWYEEPDDGDEPEESVDGVNSEKEGFDETSESK